VIYPVYFTCSDHYAELKVSLRSLASSLKGLSNFEDKLGAIHIFCDLEDFFSEEQKSNLSQIIPITIKKTIKPMSWGGIKTVENELLGFNQIRKQVNPSDWIMNIDADVIFISSNVFNIVDGADADIIGNPATHVFEAEWDRSKKSPVVIFQQGSCYFVRAGFAKELAKCYLKNRKEIISWVCQMCHVPPDAIPPDVTMHRIASQLGANIQYNSYIVEKEKSIIHLELTKDNYWHSFGSLLGIQQCGKHRVVKRD
jgi:hypothetical protein